MLVAHSVLWLCSALAEQRPLALVIDDAQWADRSSLEVLSYLARRLEDVPLLILVGARADDPDAAGGSADPARLRPLGDRPAAASADRPRRAGADPPLRPGGAGGGLPRRAIARSTATRGCSASSDGRSPRTVRRDSATAPDRDRADRRAPPRWPRSRRAIAASSRRSRSSATRAPHVLAAAAGLPLGELGPARDALLAAGLLAEDGVRFAHGLIATVIADDLPCTERERLHREAARALMAVHADPG